MKRVLILTGSAAKNLVVNFTKEFSDKIEVQVLPISIAAFMNPNLIEKKLKSQDLSKYDYILVPGLMKGDLKEISEKLEIPIYKGPRYAIDISRALEFTEDLSSVKAADFLLQQSDLKLLENAIQTQEKDPNVFILGKNAHKTAVGVNSFPVVLGEIVDAPKRSQEEIIEIALLYLEEGANIIDIGCMVRHKEPEKVFDIISMLKAHELLKDVPISIDSLDPEEILKGVEAGAELVLSIDAGNIDDLDSLARDIAIVVLPTNVRKGFMPQTPEQRVKKLIENIQIVKKRGFTRIIADPLLESPIMPGLYRSLKSYELFRNQEKETPLMFGVGNVTEMVAADSIGLNMLLACLALELNVSALLTTEHSVKSRFSISELATALKICFIAMLKKTPPKDIALNLLRAKSKEEIMPLPTLEGVKLISPDSRDEAYAIDQKGYFKIWVNHLRKQIIIGHYNLNDTIQIAFQGSSAEDLGKELVRRNLLSSYNHALYVGQELEKAEICLKLGKSYAQDENIW